jgi:hypothetical protein
VITAGLLRTAGVTVTGVDIDELDPALTSCLSLPSAAPGH